MDHPAVLLVFLGLLWAPPPAAGSSKDPVTVSEFYSQIPQRLSFYNWYGNARLFRFRVPSDAVLLRWILQASRENRPECQHAEITVHFRYGAPPVINPLGYNFAPNTSVPYSFNRTMVFTKSLQNNTFLNISNPAPGDWFIAAHLPKDPEKIEIQGFTKSCAYIFQPELFVLREVNIPILQMDSPLRYSLTPPRSLARFKIFIPEYTQELVLRLETCTSDESPTLCPLKVAVGSAEHPQSFPRTANCSGSTNCSLSLSSPPWERWLSVLVESPPWLNSSVSFQLSYSVPVCTPGTIASRSIFTFLNALNITGNSTLSRNGPLAAGNVSSAWGARSANLSSGSCLRSYPVIREELDLVSVRFQSVNGPFVPVVAPSPTVMLLSLDSDMDSGGTLVVNLRLNKTTLNNETAAVMACLSAAAPVLTLNSSQNCATAFFDGYAFKMNGSLTSGTRYVPYPEADKWYLSLQLLCPRGDSECQQLTARVMVSAYLSPCLDDCGTYGECRLLRRNGYLYTACSCKAGWAGWSCTDDRNAISSGQQLLATLLLTLSNLMFVPTIAVALSHSFFVEAAVYVYTMFFSTFYHACDQPGVAVMCIMEYDTLQYCDFFGSVVAIWVTILCMARLKTVPKYVLFMSGTLFIAMSMQLDRRGMWNMMGPCLFAIIVLVIAWTYRGVRRRHCYPPSWRRWVFFLVPGVSLAVIAIAIYVFAETQSNYYYTHSLWHILVAGSVAFLLPPREKKQKSWDWRSMLDCGYKMCKDDREELYAVT
ncbi:post-GPI attachment to proteins factor 6 [Spea bombifrons]|uniref:post-GPI attachment to proteins factor 6 n=1 Tax=Spea bombifrons TaxID=233779 RepID=UPI00234BF85A|nr:post-GPI attachment to proteins factor 6 [Spea bombifrons]XP_053327121.1 post-GPI attachment to proteins factor 6 [Spea bombifrons]XP_053327122.1 post-GPI attachment to proteins factor 6 [Spea bombifrons]